MTRSWLGVLFIAVNCLLPAMVVSAGVTGDSANKLVLKRLLTESIVSSNPNVQASDITLDILYLPAGLDQGQLSTANVWLKWPDRRRDIKGKQVIPVFKNKKKYNLIVHIHLFSDIVFAGRMIKKNEQITPEDIYVKRIDLTEFPTTVIADVAEVQGMVAAANIRKDEFFLAWMLKSSSIVKKDSLVEIVAKVDGITVKCAGRLLYDAMRNSEVWVENLDSHKKIKGILIDAHTVSVHILE